MIMRRLYFGILLLFVWNLRFIHCASVGHGNSHTHENSNNNNNRIQVVHHAPCSASTGPPDPWIEFPGMHESTLRSFFPALSCFVMQDGIVKVHKNISHVKDLHVYTKMRFGVGTKEDEPCVNADHNNIGGVGSCRYCCICGENNIKSRITMLRKGYKQKCDNSTAELSAGEYDDVALKICLPKKSEFLALLDPDPVEAQKLWDLFMDELKLEGDQGLPVLMYMYMFNVPINHKTDEELKYMLLTKQNVIGCHWLYARVFDGYGD